MSRRNKVLRNLLILAVLIPLAVSRSGLYLSPLSAHRSSERSIHYGPSTVVHVQDFDQGRYYLCKYDKWISCDTIRRAFLFFWRFGNQVTGVENDPEKPVCWTWDSRDTHCKAYGILHDNQVKKIELTLDDGSVLTQSDFYDDMFLLTWADEKRKGERNPHGRQVRDIKGYDSGGLVVYEDQQEWEGKTE